MIGFAHVPDHLRVYAIGDIHGRFDLLDPLLARINSDISNSADIESLCIFLGDYVDRGPASSRVIERLIAFGAEQNSVFLKGNHEAYVLHFLENADALQRWRRFGGLETLISYGLKPSLCPTAEESADIAAELMRSMPEHHLAFLQGLHVSMTLGDFFFAHAGVRPNVPLERQSEEDLIWIREEFLLHKESFGKIVVHGHTPVEEPDILPNRINIDTGAYATGRLTCLVLEGANYRFL